MYMYVYVITALYLWMYVRPASIGVHSVIGTFTSHELDVFLVAYRTNDGIL